MPLVTDLIASKSFAELNEMANLADFTTEQIDLLCNEYTKMLNPVVPLVLRFSKSQGKTVGVEVPLDKDSIKSYSELLASIFEHGNEAVRIHFIKNHFTTMLHILHYDPSLTKKFKLKSGLQVLTLIEQTKLSSEQLKSLGGSEILYDVINNIYNKLINPELKYLTQLKQEMINQSLLNFSAAIVCNRTIKKQEITGVFKALLELADALVCDANGNTAAHLLARSSKLYYDEEYERIMDLQKLDKDLLYNKNEEGKTVIDCMDDRLFGVFYNNNRDRFTPQQKQDLLQDAVVSEKPARMARILSQDANIIEPWQVAELENLLYVLSDYKKVFDTTILEVLKILIAKPNWNNYSLNVNGKCIWDILNAKSDINNAALILGDVALPLLDAWISTQKDKTGTSAENFAIINTRVAYRKQEILRCEDSDETVLRHTWNFIAKYGRFIGASDLYSDYLINIFDTKVIYYKRLQRFMETTGEQQQSALHIAAEHMNVNMIFNALKYSRVCVKPTGFVNEFSKAFKILVTNARETVYTRSFKINVFLNYLRDFWFGDEALLYSELKKHIEEQIRIEPNFRNNIDIKHNIHIPVKKNSKTATSLVCRPFG